MEYKVLLTVFVAVFIAELGDKTQLATMLFVEMCVGQILSTLYFHTSRTHQIVSSKS